MSLKALKAATRRVAFIPVFAVKEAKSAALAPVIEPSARRDTETRYGGQPALRPGDTWPVCGACGQEMTFLLQLNLRTLPTERPVGIPDSGLVQLWHCDECADFDGFAPTKHCRMLERSDLTTAGAQPGGGAGYPEKPVLGWIRIDEDYPHNEEESVADAGLRSEEIREYIDDISTLTHLESDKLFGWPQFVQGVEYEICPECQRQMTFLLQIASELALPVCWGDVGTAMVFICPRHPHVLTYNWACS